MGSEGSENGGLSIRVAKDPFDIAERATKDTSYRELIQHIQSGPDFKQQGKKDPNRELEAVWKTSGSRKQDRTVMCI